MAAFILLNRLCHSTDAVPSLQGVMNKRWLCTVRAYLWKEKFQLFWEYTSSSLGATLFTSMVQRSNVQSSGSSGEIRPHHPGA